MIKSNQKVIYIIIVVLLVIFSIMTIYGAYLKIFNISTIDNPEMKSVYEGKLYFYNNEELLGTYTCKSEDCKFPNATYGNYAFISDNDKYYLYDFVSGNDITTIDDIKYLDDNLSEKYLIGLVSDKYGVFDLDKMKVVVPFVYQDIIMQKDATEFLVQDDSGQYLVNNENESITDTYEEIYTYNDRFIISTEDEYYKIYDYNGLEYLWSYNINDLYITENYFVITTNLATYIYEDIEEKYVYITAEEVTVEDNGIYVDGELLEI